MNLTEIQLRFLKDEFGLEKEDIEKMNVKQWFRVREKCFDIEVEETVKADDDPLSERGEIAVRLADVKFSDLWNKQRNH